MDCGIIGEGGGDQTENGQRFLNGKLTEKSDENKEYIVAKYVERLCCLRMESSGH
jgi:hypothetical protein